MIQRQSRPVLWKAESCDPAAKRGECTLEAAPVEDSSLEARPVEEQLTDVAPVVLALQPLGDGAEKAIFRPSPGEDHRRDYAGERPAKDALRPTPGDLVRVGQ